MKHLAVLVLALALAGCASNQFAVERVNDHLYRSPQPKTAADWATLARTLGPTGLIVKLNDPAEGSDEAATAVGLRVMDLAIEPQGDGPVYAQIRGVFTEPDRDRVSHAVSLACTPGQVVDVHCTHGFDRTGYIIARERVECEGWTPAAAHEEWHRHAHYVPYGDRIPAPGLEESRSEFVRDWQGTR